MTEEMKEYKAYLFDLYGTLVDIHTDELKPSFWKKVWEMFAEHGIRYDWKDLRDAYFQKVTYLEKQKEEPGRYIEIDLREVFGSLLSSEGICPDQDTVKEVMERFRELSTTHLRLYAGAKDLLGYLKDKGKKVILLSNAQEVFTLRELKALGIYELFDEIFISSAVGYRKPDPVFFQYALKKCDLKKEDCLMIGNDLFCDVEGAKETGIDVCYIRSALSPKEEKPVQATYVLDRMDLRRLKQMTDISMKKETK